MRVFALLFVILAALWGAAFYYELGLPEMHADEYVHVFVSGMSVVLFSAASVLTYKG